MIHTIPAASSPLSAGASGSLRRASLEISHLVVHYDRCVAVNDICFSVFPGEIFGLLGPNGAGKTSTLAAVEGLIIPKSGSVSVLGVEVSDNPLRARANLGVQLQATSFQQDLTISEIVQLYAGLYGIDLSASQVDGILADIELSKERGKKTRQLSGGQQQRLSLAVATLHKPPVVLLDEPTSGLDPQSRRQLWRRIESMRDCGCGILLTTHSMEEAKAVCDRVAIISQGKLIATDTPARLIDLHSRDPRVQRATRSGETTLEDVFIGLTEGAEA